MNHIHGPIDFIHFMEDPGIDAAERKSMTSRSRLGLSLTKT